MLDGNLSDLLKLMTEKDASDIHLQVGSHPMFRIHGEIVRLTDFPPIDEKELKEMIYKSLADPFIEIFEKNWSLDTALGIAGVGRFRISIFQQRGTIGLVGRRIPQHVPNFEMLNLPASISKIADFNNGLVLVTGATGCGKSSTLAALINQINHRSTCHILCIEDPIEFLYQNDRAVITQREVGVDVDSFKSALRYALRQDPDVILVGEIRDEETVDFALRASETGHLVFGTLHSSNATQTIGRLLNFFPQSEHGQLRQSLSMQLKAVVSQMLLPSCREGLSRVPASEIMFVTSPIKRLIAEGHDEKIIKAIKSGIKEWGMQDFEHSLYQLINDGFVTRETALEFADNPHSLEMKLKGFFLDEEGGLVG